MRTELWRLSVPQEEHYRAWVPERNVSVISFIRLGGNSRQVEAQDLSARTWSAPRRPKRCQQFWRNSWSVSRRSAVEGTVERKRPAPCCEDCEMLHLTSRGRELLRVKIIFFANTPFIVQYIVQYYRLLHPPPSFEVFLRCVEFLFCFFRSRISDGSRCLKKKSVLDREKKGVLLYYCTLLCNTSLPTPLYCLQYCAIYFPHDPLYCNKILAMSCKGQPTIKL